MTRHAQGFGNIFLFDPFVVIKLSLGDVR